MSRSTTPVHPGSTAAVGTGAAAAWPDACNASTAILAITPAKNPTISFDFGPMGPPVEGACLTGPATSRTAADVFHCSQRGERAVQKPEARARTARLAGWTPRPAHSIGRLF